jgi:malonyl-CoA/methylmalonyl-CoA synthetase
VELPATDIPDEICAGLKPGDRVLLSGGTSVSTVLSYIALMRSGFVVVPANVQYTKPELLHIANDADVSACIVDDIERAKWITESFAEQHRQVPLAFSTSQLIEAASSDSAHTANDDSVPPIATDLAMICYTSGTTGKPKGAELTHGNLLAGAAAVTLAWQWRARDRLLLTLPLFHMHGLGT